MVVAGYRCVLGLFLMQRRVAETGFVEPSSGTEEEKQPPAHSVMKEHRTRGLRRISELQGILCVFSHIHSLAVATSLNFLFNIFEQRELFADLLAVRRRSEVTEHPPLQKYSGTHGKKACLLPDKRRLVTDQKVTSREGSTCYKLQSLANAESLLFGLRGWICPLLPPLLSPPSPPPRLSK
ncbi:hypothetical protein HJG60_008768 [Phyllostomus discolor]|uniref:Uncharacterized protein n=1 Tax=Phyllostomus discolor TaxID=89673 RepID=A0A833YWG1_9CHIR|nr:hypothetical protein HJG60_008768 [Phyllostomus discolor]